MFDRAKFFAALRRADSGVFGKSLSPGQVAGVEAILDEAARRGTSLKHLAYILATPYLETGGRMQPVRESLNYSVEALLNKFSRRRISAADARRYGRSGARKADQVAIANCIYGGDWGAENLGNTQPGDGWRFRGGGLPQTTGRRNFEKFGIDPEQSEDLATSVRMMFDGMEGGLYTGRKLSDFADYRDMRRVINGTDRADTVAGYARAFEKALKTAGWDGEPDVIWAETRFETSGPHKEADLTPAEIDDALEADLGDALEKEFEGGPQPLDAPQTPKPSIRAAFLAFLLSLIHPRKGK